MGPRSSRVLSSSTPPTNPPTSPNYEYRCYMGPRYAQVTYVFSGTRMLNYSETNAATLRISDMVMVKKQKRARIGFTNTEPYLTLTCYIPLSVMTIQRQCIASVLTCNGDLGIKGLTYVSDSILWHVLYGLLNRTYFPILLYCPIGTFSHFMHVLQNLRYEPNVTRCTTVINKLLCLGYYFMGAFSSRHQKHSITRYLLDIVLEAQACWNVMKIAACNTKSMKVKEAYKYLCYHICPREAPSHLPDFLDEQTYTKLLMIEAVVTNVLCGCPDCKPTFKEVQKKSRTGRMVSKHMGLDKFAYSAKFDVVIMPNVPEVNRRILKNSHEAAVCMPVLYHVDSLENIHQTLKQDNYMERFYTAKYLGDLLVMNNLDTNDDDVAEFFTTYSNFMFLCFLGVQVKKFYKMDIKSFYCIYFYYLRLLRRLITVDFRDDSYNGDNCVAKMLDPLLESMCTNKITQALLGEIVKKFYNMSNAGHFLLLIPESVRDNTSHQARALLDYLIETDRLYDDPTLNRVLERRRALLEGQEEINVNRYTLQNPEWFIPAAAAGLS